MEVHGLTIRYGSTGPEVVRDVDLSLGRGEILGIVGESGAGKSTVGRALMGLVDQPGEIVAGRGRLGETPLFDGNRETLHALRGKRISLILQEPLSALNPVINVGEQVAEAVRMAGGPGGADGWSRALDLLSQVGISDPAIRARDYPHQFSGGMRQRVLIAIAIAGAPEVIVADEPTTALDVSIQAEVLDLLRKLAKERHISILLITHDIAVVAEFTDRIIVMRFGAVVETGATADVLAAPQAEYTRALLATVPPADRTLERFEVLGALATARARSTNVRSVEQALSVSGVSVVFEARRRMFGATPEGFLAVDDVSFEVPAGGSFGIVGESGSGKSTLLMALLGLVSRSAGVIRIGETEVPRAPSMADRRKLASLVQVVFQDPFSSLNPRMRVRDIVAEPLHASGDATRATAREKAESLLSLVGLPVADQSKLPHQFSGGQRQRIAIARALIRDPAILLCDEPTSALDVSIQAQILNLIKDLQRDHGLTLIFVSHDLAVVRQMCQRIGVMEKSRMVEQANAAALFDTPQHPYTKRLLQMMPRFVPSSAGAA
nr:ABC transporter ATP-binding protein [Boseongicola sp. H5]